MNMQRSFGEKATEFRRNAGGVSARRQRLMGGRATEYGQKGIARWPKSPFFDHEEASF